MKSLLILISFSIIIASTQAAPVPFIKNFIEVNSNLYRGARPANISALDQLAKLGIKSIVNLQGGDLKSEIGFIIPLAEPGERASRIATEKMNTKALGMNFLNIPLNSLDRVTKSEDIAIDQALEFMNNPINQPVFIHCEHGKDRTGLLVALYEVKYLGFDPERAHDEWVASGHNRLSRLLTGVLDRYYYKKVKSF